VTKSRYWTGRGRSSPMATRMRSTSSSVARRPAMIRAGSPGRTRTMMKTISETPTSASRLVSTRLVMYWSVPFTDSATPRLQGQKPGQAGRPWTPRPAATGRLPPSVGRPRVDGVEQLVGQVRHAGDVLGVHDGEALVPQEDPRRVVHDKPRRLAVQVGPGLHVDLAGGPFQQVFHFGVG